jgi:outer membrane receptor for ferrienterochelin and colicins
MNLIKHLISLVIVLIPFCGLTQTLSVFSGEDKLPVPQAVVRCVSLRSSSEKVITADNEGKVVISVLAKEELPWAISISFSGHETLTDTLYDLSSRSYFLKTVYELGEVVVTAQYRPTNVENSVFKMRVITAQKIQAMGAQNLRDVLANELNIRISQDNILGSGINMQGISGQNVKILVDGVPVVGRLNGNIDVSQLVMDNVERIEVIEGPLSVVYGTDALAGTINIITKKSQLRKFSFNAGSYNESNGN